MFVWMPVYFFKITLKPNKIITGLRHFDTHDIDYVYRKTSKKAQEVFTADLINLDVFMVHRLSKYYAQWLAERGTKRSKGK